MTPTQAFWFIVLNVAVTMVGSWFHVWLVRRAQQQDLPHEEIAQLARDVVSLRGQVKYIEGRLNGKHWKQEA